MQLYYDGSGNLLHAIPEEVYQGSANANTVYFIGAFPNNCVVAIAYRLPNGDITEQQLLSLVTETELTNVQTPSGQSFNVWKRTLDNIVTENYGTATIQFFVYDGAANANAQANALATQTYSFNVLKGVPYLLPDDLSTGSDLLTEILDALSAFGDVYEYRTEAVNAATQAQASATAASTSATQAASSATAAAQSATNAQTAETNATQAATQAQDSATSALNSANAAALSASQAQNAATQNAKDIDNIYTIIGATVTDEYPLSQAYSTRETADGNADIIDGALTRVTKIQGATVATTNLFNPDRTITNFAQDSPNTDSREFNETAMYKGLYWNNYSFPRQITNASYTNGTLTFSTTYSGAGVAIPFKVLPNTQYTMTAHISSNGRLSASFYTNDGVWISGTEKNTTFTTPNNCRWMCIVVNSSSSTETAQTITCDKIQLVNGDAKPYRPYFSGLRNAYFKGVRSTGKNLFNPNSIQVRKNYLDEPNPRRATSEKLSINDDSSFTIQVVKFPTNVSRYEINFYNNVGAYVGGGWIYDSEPHSLNRTQYLPTATYFSITFGAQNDDIVLSENDFKDIEVYLNKGNSIFSEPYKADESFMLDEAVELGKWDYIDIQEENGIISATIIKQTATETSETAFTEEQLAEYTDYVLSADGLTVAYKSQSIIDEEALVIPTDKYKSWVHGSETQVQGDTADTDNSADGANCTVSQDYYTQKGA